MVSGLLLGWACAAIGLWLCGKALRGVHVASFADAAWAGVLLAVLNWALHRALVVLIGIGTLGLGFIFRFLSDWLATALVVLFASKISSRLRVDGFGTALLAALIIAATSALVRALW